jgi:hypothetical protein
VFFERGAEGCLEQVRQIFERRGLCAEIIPAEVEKEGYCVT